MGINRPHRGLGALTRVKECLREPRRKKTHSRRSSKAPPSDNKRVQFAWVAFQQISPGGGGGGVLETLQPSHSRPPKPFLFPFPPLHIPSLTSPYRSHPSHSPVYALVQDRLSHVEVEDRKRPPKRISRRRWTGEEEGGGHVGVNDLIIIWFTDITPWLNLFGLIIRLHDTSIRLISQFFYHKCKSIN